jgi:hypothetical protein
MKFQFRTSSIILAAASLAMLCPQIATADSCVVEETRTIQSSGPTYTTTVPSTFTETVVERPVLIQNTEKTTVEKTVIRDRAMAPATRVIVKRVLVRARPRPMRIVSMPATKHFYFKTRTIQRTVEKPVVVERPVFIDRPVDRIIEKPVYINHTIETPVYRDRIVEKPVYIEKQIERPVMVEKPIVVERRVLERPVVVERQCTQPVVIERPVVIKKDRHHLFNLKLF